VLVVGDNGAGKTNLLEALHVGTQGFSPRTRTERDLIRFGQTEAALSLALVRDGVPHEVRMKLAAGAAKTAQLDGARLPSADSLRRELPALVFTPDRLAVVKGGPAARRAYFDRVTGRLQPAQASLAQDYAAVLAQRNAALRRVQLELSTRDAIEPWTVRVAELGSRLVSARRDTLAQLEPGFAERAGELGLDEHPTKNVQKGSANVKGIIDALMKSPTWGSSVFILTFDEGGGAFDHVVPIAQPKPDGIPPMLRSTDIQAQFDQAGFRLPVWVVSPWSKPNFVSHTPRDFTSILKLIETRFGLTALTARDGAADDMTEFFDFSTAHFATPPALPAQPITGVCDKTKEKAPGF